MAARSKELRSGRRIFGCVGSNPTPVSFLFNNELHNNHPAIYSEVIQNMMFIYMEDKQDVYLDQNRKRQLQKNFSDCDYLCLSRIITFRIFTVSAPPPVRYAPPPPPRYRARAITNFQKRRCFCFN